MVSDRFLWYKNFVCENFYEWKLPQKHLSYFSVSWSCIIRYNTLFVLLRYVLLFIYHYVSDFVGLFFPTRPPFRCVVGVLLLWYIGLWYTRILDDSFMLLYVWLYATFDGDRPLFDLVVLCSYLWRLLYAYSVWLYATFDGDRPSFWSCCSLHVFMTMLVFITNYEKLYAYRIIRLEWG